MVKDINEGEAGHFQAIYNLTTVENRLYFVVRRDAKDGYSGKERDLWTSDGTELGTHKVQGFPSEGAYDQFYYLKNIGNSLYCISQDHAFNDKRYTLWHVDTNGAVAMKKYDAVHEAVDLNGKAYFLARTLRAEKWKLWKSDGTKAGTERLLYMPFDERAQGLKSVDGTLYFYTEKIEIIDDVRTNYIIYWKYDSREGSIVQTGKTKMRTSFPAPSARVKLGDKQVFTTYDEEYGVELWIGGGDQNNSVLLKDITEGEKSSKIKGIIHINGTIYFTKGYYGNQLWKTDGTTDGTVRVQGIDSGTEDSNPQKLVQMKKNYYFTAHKAGYTSELWKSDGAKAGTVILKDSADGGVITLGATNDAIYFNTYTRNNYVKMWKSDGTEGGTIMLKEDNVSEIHYYDVDDWYNTQYFDINGTTLFRGYDKEHGFELWSTDGTQAGTKLFLDIDKNETSSMPRQFLEINDKLYFTAFDSATGISLWKSDGTVVGTQQLLALPEGYDNKQYKFAYRGGPRNLTDVNGTLFFTMNVDENNTELWKSDGTKAGTVAVKRFKKLYSMSQPFGLTNINGILYFVPIYVNNSANHHGWELWKSDGTEKGTTLVAHVGKDKYSGSHQMGKPTYFKGKVYFSLPDDEQGTELWMSDGTIEGTKLFKDFKTGKESSNPVIRGVLNDSLMFEATDDRGRKLWKTDGTVEGTEMVKDGLR